MPQGTKDVSAATMSHEERVLDELAKLTLRRRYLEDFSRLAWILAVLGFWKLFQGCRYFGCALRRGCFEAALIPHVFFSFSYLN